MGDILDSAFKTDEEMNFKSTRNDKTKVMFGSVIHHEPVHIPLYGNYNHNQEEKGCTCENKEHNDCTVICDILDNAQRTLRYCHNKLNHIGFNQLRNLANRHFLPKIIAKVRKIKCPDCQQGKAIMSSSEEKNKITTD